MEFEHKVAALDDEDLVVGEKEEKNWKGIVISLLVIGSIMGAIVIAIILCTPDGDADSSRVKLDFDHVVSDAYKLKPFSGAWVSDKEIVYVDQNGGIVIFDAERNRSTSVLVKTYDKSLHTMNGFKLSSDRNSILFVTDVRTEFGARKSARYAIFNVSSQTVEFLDDFIKSHYPMKQPQVQYAAWGPLANSLVFIESNDIYFVPDYSAAQSGQMSPVFDGKLSRFTKTGAISDSITNGLPDNLYRTNIFSQASDEATLWWSPDGRYLAYLTFDDALVDQMPIEFYDNYMHDSNLNPRIHYERYPRAGAMNPHVSVHVVDVLPSYSGSIDEIESNPIMPPTELIKQQQADPRQGYYVTYVGWLSKNSSDLGPMNHQLLVMWSNRAQNSSTLTACDPAGRTGWRCEILTTFLHRIPPSFNARQTVLPTYNSNGTRLIFFALPRPDSIIGDHYHVTLLRGEERAPKYLTHGQFDVDRLLSYDPQSDTLYFEVMASDRAERHLYKITSVGQITTRQTRCLTCHLEEPCGYNKAHISPMPGSKFLVHECFGPGVPTTRMRRLDSDRLKSLLQLNIDSQIENLVRSRQMPIEKFISIKANQQFPYDVNIKLYLPNESEDEKDKRFPLLVESSEISKRNVWRKFELDWGKYLASKKQLAYAKIDCIKAGPQMPSASTSYNVASELPGGSKANLGFSSASAGINLDGVADTDDTDSPLASARVQIEAIKFLIENSDEFPYIDKRRVAIWGPTSTSAYMALTSTLADDSKIIQCTMAVSPITNWRFMSSYVAEHYLGLPWVDTNTLKYERSNLLKRSSEFAMRKLLIVHGTADEQVHVQHSMQFIKALTEHHPLGGVIHQMQLYPDVGHSLEPVKKHFYLTLDGFIDRCFYQKPIAIRATEWKGKRPKLY